MRYQVLFYCWLLGCCDTSVIAQTDFFYSFSDLNSGAVNSTAQGHFAIGDSGSIFIYYSVANSDLDTGAFLDIATDTEGVIEFTGGETFEFPITVSGNLVAHRWSQGGTDGKGGSFGAGTVSENGQLLSMNAFTVTQLGIQFYTAPFVSDLGYDVEADSYLFGRLDFDVIGQGTVDLVTEPGSGGIVNSGMTVDASFGNATIVANVPEPNSTAVACFMLLVFSSLRRGKICER